MMSSIHGLNYDFFIINNGNGDKMEELLKTERNEQQLFLQTLHHDNRNSYISKFKAHEGQFSAVSLATLEDYNQTTNTYISLNGFTRYGRNSIDIRQINCIYFDLDMHDQEKMKELKLNSYQVKMEYIDECINNTLNVLYDAFNSEELPEPTMITNSGRGLGIFYVLDRSIACAGGRNQKQVDFWERIYRGLAVKFKQVLISENNQCAQNPEALLEFDEKVVGDVSRVARMPMTFNQAAARQCKLIYSDGDYYALSDLYKYVGKLASYPKVSISGNIVQVDFFACTFHRERLEAIESLQKYRNYNCNGNREQMCFCYYNEAKQLYGEEMAKIMVESFNQKFTEALCQGEIKTMIRGVNNNHGKSHKGYYKLANDWIIDTLQVSSLEQEATGIKVTKRQIQRAMLKEKHVREREERNQAIVSYAKAHPECPYQDIAELFGVCLSTVKKTLANASFRRNTKQKQGEINEMKKEKTAFEKSIKNCPIVCCVSEVLPDLAGSLTILKNTMNKLNNNGSVLQEAFSFQIKRKRVFIENHKHEWVPLGRIEDLTMFFYGGNDNIVMGESGKLYHLIFKVIDSQIYFIQKIRTL